jgi:hypothetical protein
LIGLDEWEKLNDVSELAHGYVQRDIVKLGNCVPQSRTNRNVLDRTSRRIADVHVFWRLRVSPRRQIQSLVILQTAVSVAEQQDVG